MASLQARAGNLSEINTRMLTPSKHPAAMVVSPESPASSAYLSKNRNSPEARAAYVQARYALPPAGLPRGTNVNSYRSRYAN